MSQSDDRERIVARRARIEEIRELAEEYRREQAAIAEDGRPSDVPLPQGGIYWLARDVAGEEVGYAAGTMRPIGCQIGPVFTRSHARRRGVGEALLTAIQTWAETTRVPVVEISVAADNHDGQAFLESLGYVPRRVLMSLTPGEAATRSSSDW
ncbi:MAG: GNAT family N-acetyltransferase [Nitriliruptor sp.]